MRKDYAKRSVRSKRSPEKGWVGRLLLVFLIIGLLGVSSYGFYFYKTHSFQSLDEWLATAKSFFHHAKPLPKNEVANVLPQPVESDPGIHFDFYTELSAEHSVMPVKNISKNQLEVISVQQKTAVTHYIVQLGLFRNESEANKLRLSMLLEGVESQIIKTTSGYYRLQQGPYPTLANAEEVQNKLKSKGIVSLIHHADPAPTQGL